MDKTLRTKACFQANLISTVSDILLTGAKLSAGILGNSAAMIADGIHSASDIVTDLVVLISMKISQQDADEDHPYGHGRFETLASLFISIVLLIVAVGIIWDASLQLLTVNQSPTQIAAWAALASIFIKEVLFRYNYQVGTKFNAKAIISNAWHHRSDAISSIAALFGIIGAMAGYPILDSVAAIVVAFIIAKTGLDLTKQAINELADTTIEQQVINHLTEQLNNLPGVVSVHQLRARRHGPDILADVHVVVPHHYTVSEGHKVAESVIKHVKTKEHNFTEVIVHIDTDDSEELFPDTPLRQDLEQQIKKAIQTANTSLINLYPHYTRKGLKLDIILAMNDQHRDALDKISNDLENSLSHIPSLVETNILFSLNRHNG
jgi:cation diffusion facilitator family transporter